MSANKEMILRGLATHLFYEAKHGFESTPGIDRIEDALRMMRDDALEEAAKIAFSLSSPLESKSASIEASRNTADTIGHLIRNLRYKSK